MTGEDGLVTGELRIGGLDRGFTLRLPRDRPAGELPIALVLHGNHPQAGGWLMREWTTFDQQADTWGWAVAYPDGHGGSWADGRGSTAADESGVDDVAFLRAILDWSAERHGTVADRAVVAGMSNGAFMAHRMATEASDRIAVLAAVAGGLPGALLGHEPTHAVSALLMHGTEDSIASIDGGYSRRRGPNGELRGRMLSLRETAARWRAVDRCPPEASTTIETAWSERTTTAGGIGGTTVAAWTLIGSGHTWPGRPTPPEWSEPTSTEFDAAEEICRFAKPLLIPPATRRR